MMQTSAAISDVKGLQATVRIPTPGPMPAAPRSMLLWVVAQDTLTWSHSFAIPNPDDGEPSDARADWKWLEDERVRIPPE
jgi:hypothetical protein